MSLIHNSFRWQRGLPVTLKFNGEKEMSHKKVPMTLDAASRIVSNEAKNNVGKIAKNGFAAKAMSAAAKNANKGVK
jgi:hypothetical protein